jgi:plasmanylethanolamine desaturase
MLTIPFLAYMVWHFLSSSEEKVQEHFLCTCYLFLLAIFVALTNQVFPLDLLSFSTPLIALKKYFFALSTYRFFFFFYKM